jgi:hypothetical protein
MPFAAGEFFGMKPIVHSTHTLSRFGVRLWIMWLRIHRSVVLYDQPKPFGVRTIVFSSPAAKVGLLLMIHTA